jgi:hypothetical protein
LLAFPIFYQLNNTAFSRRLEETTKNLKRMAAELETEKQKTEELLCELMPASVAESLRSGHTVEACEFPEATLLFTDIGKSESRITSKYLFFSYFH